ncbi:MAG: 50S ribosomal protein L11 methyltransferase [Acidithiobacillus sp.]|nr:50S ribosomal protein L11 methyltransferase [Acidithiobacillus sp.]
MSESRWWQLSLQVRATDAAMLEAELLAAGAEAVSWLEEDTEEPIFEGGVLWSRSRCEALFPDTKEAQAQIEKLRSQPHWQDLHSQVRYLPAEDWVARTQAAFPAQSFGRIWVAPHWDAAPEGTLVLHLDPGRAFGTGAHPTTALCLRWLSAHIIGNESVLDYGCGSGVLAIAALLLGAKQAVGVDTDPVALEVARENAERNGVGERLQLFLPEEAPVAQYSVVLANILAGPLITLAPTLTAFSQPGAALVLSGLLHEQEEAVQTAYQANFSFAPTARQEDWSLLSGTRITGEIHGSSVSPL